MSNYNIFYEHLFFIPAITFVFTVLLKGLFIKIKTGKLNLSASLGTGGMPSAHSSLVVSLTTAIALKYGFNSDIFVICMIFTMIIIYDAINIRFEAGQHAGAINEILGQKRFNESLGHLPSEAFAGSLLGILLALILYYI